MTSEPVHIKHLHHPPLDHTTRTRIAPAPSGELHVGNVRTALYSWALARQHGGTFILRVEDTDRSRVTDEAFAAAVRDLRWMGLDFDEGPDVGGPFAPYRQSERLDVYATAVEQLLASGAAYRAFDTTEELEQARTAAGAAKKPYRYDGSRWKALTPAESLARAEGGEAFVVRFAMAPGSTTWLDLVRGEVTIDHAELTDFALTRKDSYPLYPLAAPVDDMAMGLTHIIRGEDLVTATPRQLALYAALGLPQEKWPAFGHLPLIVGEDNKPLSKRNGEVAVAAYRRAGFLSEAMVNYLSLLGWSPPVSAVTGEAMEVFTPGTLVQAFSLDKVSRNPARFDTKKLGAINGDHIRMLTLDDLGSRLVPFLAEAGVDVLARPETWTAVVPLLAERLKQLTDAAPQVAFLFGPVWDDAAAREKHLVPASAAALSAAVDALSALVSWTKDDIEAALRTALLDGLGLKPRVAFGPLYVAVTGRAASIPLFDGLALLGRETALERLQAGLAACS